MVLLWTALSDPARLLDRNRRTTEREQVDISVDQLSKHGTSVRIWEAYPGVDKVVDAPWPPDVDHDDREEEHAS